MRQPMFSPLTVLLAILTGGFWGFLAGEALATPAQELAASAGVTVEQAQRDITAQEGAPGIVERLEGALGADYAGVWFNNKTGKFIVPIAPGSSKATAKAAMGSTAAGYPLVARTLDTLEAKRDELASPSLAVYMDPKANAVRVLYASSMNTAQKSSVKAKAEPGVIVQSAKASGFHAEPEACDFPYCHDEVLGGIRINGPMVSGRPTVSCSAAFMAENGWGDPFVLTAGHCTLYPLVRNASEPWLPRPNWTTDTIGGGPVPPFPALASECRLWPAGARLSEDGDFAVLRLENCGWRPTVVSWFSAQDELTVKALKPIFNCMEGSACSVPSHEKAYPGLFQCHYGQHADLEQPGERYASNCGVVYATDTQTAISYASPLGITTVKHLDLTCARGVPGDSGSGAVAPVGTHGIATGIHIAGYGAESTECGTRGKLWSQEIGPALGGLRVHLP